jgi:hypothetical protein
LITDTYVKWLAGVWTFRDKIHCFTPGVAHLQPRPSCPQIPCLATISKAKHAAWTRSAPMRLLEARYPSSSSKLNSSTPWCLMMFHNVSRVFLGTVIKCCKGCSVERLSASFTGQAGFPLSHWTKRQVDQLKAPRSSVPPIFGAFFFGTWNDWLFLQILQQIWILQILHDTTRNMDIFHEISQVVR